MPSKDRWKRNQHQRDYYRRNRDAAIARIKEANARQIALITGYARRAKEVPCADCGIRYPHYVMDFDHVRGKKVRAVADLIRNGVSLRTVRMEIAKCEVVCSNCHRARTWNRLQAAKAERTEVILDDELRLF